MKTRYCHLWPVFFCALSFSHAVSAESEFDAYKKQTAKEFQQQKNEFEIYRKKLLGEFEQYRKLTSATWGKKHNVMPDKTNWVSYPGSVSNRSVVNFENGTVDVAVAIDADKNISDKEARKRLSRTILATLREGADMRPMSQLARQPVSQPTGEALLTNQVANTNGKPLTQSDYKNFSASEAGNARHETIRGDDGKLRTVYHASFALVPDHIKERAQRYQKPVDSNAREQQIPSALVFAVMETESMFNPNARSPAPAFGLMQLVPTSGAREAYRYLHNRDHIVTDTYLYNPENNIELGTAYLNRLYHSYLAGIQSQQARVWATIAAYNTGPTNVLRTFAGSYSRSRFGSRSHWQEVALADINRRSPEQVYRFMRTHLPYAETRRYLEKVRSRMPKYQ